MTGDTNIHLVLLSLQVELDAGQVNNITSRWNAILLLKPYPFISRMSRDFDNFRAMNGFWIMYWTSRRKCSWHLVSIWSQTEYSWQIASLYEVNEVRRKFKWCTISESIHITHVLPNIMSFFSIFILSPLLSMFVNPLLKISSSFLKKG